MLGSPDNVKEIDVLVYHYSVNLFILATETLRFVAESFTVLWDGSDPLPPWPRENGS